MLHRLSTLIRLASGAAALAFCTTAGAMPVVVTVTVENLAPANSISFAPLRLGFGNGTFDAFNTGETATAPIISVAEGGSGSAWFPAFAAAEPNAVLGSVGGALLPGATASNSFVVDSSVNRFFTFGSMVIPSNDLFIGNDSPTAFQLLDVNGNLLITSIGQTGAAIWDAGSEAADPANAAFVQGGNNSARTPQNGVVSFSFAELTSFDGVTTAAGYVYDNDLLTAGTGIYRISFAVSDVPEPSTFFLMTAGLLAIGWTTRRRRAEPALPGLASI